jgi:NTE family protein
MSKCTAVVLGSGGSRGALQVGALRALLEAGYVPDLLVGTSIGAANATGLAMWGLSLDGLTALERVWERVASAEMLDPRVGQLILRAMMGRPSDSSRKKVENYFSSLGITKDLTFGMAPYSRLALISADIDTGQTLIYGQNQDDFILEGLLASIAVPPWFMPLQVDGRMIMDGGIVSPLPIEPALRMGATEIIALDLVDPTIIPKENPTIPQLFQQYLFMANQRQIELETQIAKMQGVQVRRIDFKGLVRTTMWNFSDYRRLRQAGYEKAKSTISEWNAESPSVSVLLDPAVQ